MIENPRDRDPGIDRDNTIRQTTLWNEFLEKGEWSVRDTHRWIVAVLLGKCREEIEQRRRESTLLLRKARRIIAGCQRVIWI